MNRTRRSLVSAIGLLLPFGLGSRRSDAASVGPAPVLGFRPFEEAVRAAFPADTPPGAADPGRQFPCRRVEVGYSEEVQAGVQGCHNDRPFAGFPAGHLRIVRVSSGPGPAVRGVRLSTSTVDVVLTGGRSFGTPSRPLDFSTLPAAPYLS